MIWLSRHEDFLDENIPNVTVLELQTIGNDVLDIRGTPQQGMLDDELWGAGSERTATARAHRQGLNGTSRGRPLGQLRQFRLTTPYVVEG